MFMIILTYQNFIPLYTTLIASVPLDLQMATTWNCLSVCTLILQRKLTVPVTNEAIWLQESYLIWLEKQLLSIIRKSKDSTMDEEEDVQVQLIDPVNVTQHHINITDSCDNNLNSNNTMTMFSLVK